MTRESDLLKDATAQDHRIALGVSVGLAAIVFVLAIVFLRGLWMIVLGLGDLGRARTIEGRVLRVRTRNERTYVAVDDGSADHVAVWVTTAGAHQGSDVRIRVATRCRLRTNHRDDGRGGGRCWCVRYAPR